jgi:hypothetical protein
MSLAATLFVSKVKTIFDSGELLNPNTLSGIWSKQASMHSKLVHLN